MNNIPNTVLQFGNLHLHGDITPSTWYKHIKTEAGKVDLQAITVLSHIIYFYRPIRSINPYTREEVVKKKFKSDKLQLNGRHLEERFGLTRSVAKRVLSRLEKQGFIKREFRNLKIQNVTYSNVQYVEPVFDKIKEITSLQDNHNKNKTITQPSYKEVIDSTIKSSELPDIGNKISNKKVAEIASDLTWPKGLKKTNALLDVLKDLKTNLAQQQVLDVYVQQASKQSISNPVGFLKALVKNHNTGNFTKAKSKIVTAEMKLKLDNQEFNDNRKQAIKQCPYCDQGGLITYENTNNNTTHSERCSHNIKIIQYPLQQDGFNKITTINSNITHPPIKPAPKSETPICTWKEKLETLNLKGLIKAIASNFKLNHINDVWSFEIDLHQIARPEKLPIYKTIIEDSIKQVYGNTQEIIWDTKTEKCSQKYFPKLLVQNKPPVKTA